MFFSEGEERVSVNIIFGLGLGVEELGDGVGEGEDSSPPVEALLSCCNDMLMVAIKGKKRFVMM